MCLCMYVSYVLCVMCHVFCDMCYVYVHVHVNVNVYEYVYVLCMCHV